MDRSTIRAALSHLAEQNIIVRQPGRRPWVNTQTTSHGEPARERRGDFRKLSAKDQADLKRQFSAETIWVIFSMLNHDQITYATSISGKMDWNQ